jgi:hypothetical protein
MIFYLQMRWHIEGRLYSFMEVQATAPRHHAESLTGDGNDYSL